MKTNKNLSSILIAILLLMLLVSILLQITTGSVITTNISRLFDADFHSDNSSDLNGDSKNNTIKNSDDITNDTPAIPSKKRIALTFDDGPHPVYTLKLLDGLRERNVKVTFFVIGKNASSHPEILKKISEEGHLIGNHTFTHVQLSCISVGKAIDEINKTNEVIETSTGRPVEYIRPPYGSLPKSLEEETNLTPVLWTVDPRDWSVLNTDSVVKHIISRAKDGDIILLHDIFETSVDAALIVVDKLSQEGFEFVTVDELLAD